MTSFKIYFSQVKSLLKCKIASFYFMHAFSFCSILRCLQLFCEMQIVCMSADCFHKVVHLTEPIKLLCNILL